MFGRTEEDVLTHVIIDCDDVALHYIGGFRDRASAVLGREVEDWPRTWNMDDWLGTDTGRAMEIVAEFNEDHEGFGALGPVDGAVEAVAALREAGATLHVVTSACRGKAAIARRIANLEAVFGADAFDEVVILPLGSDKRDALSRFPAGSWWIEDNPRNAAVGAEVGLRALLMPACHNGEAFASPPPGVRTVSGWEEVVFLVTADMGVDACPSA